MIYIKIKSALLRELFINILLLMNLSANILTNKIHHPDPKNSVSFLQNAVLLPNDKILIA
jgi:hypothetical protein